MTPADVRLFDGEERSDDSVISPCELLDFFQGLEPS